MSAGVGAAEAQWPRPSELDPDHSYAALHSHVVGLESRRDVVLVHGPDARSWLQGQVSQDLDPLAPGGSAETLVLSPQGKVESYCRATMLGTDAFVLDTDAGYGEQLAARLRRFRLRVKVELDLATVRCLAMSGPAAPDVLASFVATLGPAHDSEGSFSFSDTWWVAVPVRWTGFDGFDVLGPGTGRRWPEGVAACDPQTFEAARIEAGLPVMGRELTEKTIPQEAGALVGHTVSFSKGCYTGQELVARLDARGGNVARRLRAVVLGEGPPAEPGDALVVGDREVGHLTSVAWSPGRAAQVGLAYVRRDVVPPAAVLLPARDTRATVEELPGS